MKLSKLDRGLCSLVLGREYAMAFSKGQGDTTVPVVFKTWRMPGGKSCQQALNHQIAENARESGHERPTNMRPVRSDDAYLVGDSVVVQVPAVGGPSE